jgi:solute carrier family 25 (adenine nucleotide translocator) protein 4/5/6/31
MDFLLGGLSAAVSKLGAGPVNRAKIVHQAQGELLRQGRLGRPYGGLTDALARTVRAEGPLSLWRGAMYDVISYFPTQALNFALKDSFKKLFPFDRRQHGYGLWFFGTPHLHLHACECCVLCVCCACCVCCVLSATHAYVVRDLKAP